MALASGSCRGRRREAEDMGERVGFIGLGVMGRPMAHNLVRAGLDVVVQSRSPAPVDELVNAGAARADTPGELASG
ncbi:MAG: NAD(P)-binding domain-containing protein, partial [Actinomycetota bacterium]